MGESRGGKKAHSKVEHLNALTSLRFFAAMYVLAFHYAPSNASSSFLRFGYTGVTFFFILSGFILAHNYQGVDFRDRFNRYSYFSARIARIYPVFLLSLLASLPFALAHFIQDAARNP